MKKNGVICFLLCAVMLIAVAIPVAANADEAADIAAAKGCHSPDAQFSLLTSEEPLVKNVRSAFVYELNSDTMIYALNPDAAEEPASLVKTMTALIAIENGNLADTVTIKQTVLDTIPKGMVSAKLVADEVLTLEDLLYCLMVGSASDAAIVIADHICGSQEAFVQLMNDRAAEIGCTGTYFTNTHGLYHQQQVTTARDTAKNLKAALENESFAKIFSSAYYTVPATNMSEERSLVTNNFLMSQDDTRAYFDERVSGGRTGVTQDGTRCIASTAEVDGMKLICVVMGSASEYRADGKKVRSFGGFPETSAFLDICFEGYKSVQVIYDGQVLTQRPVINGNNAVSLGVTTSVSTVLPKDFTAKQLSFRYTEESFTAPITAGDPLSVVEIWYENLCVGQAQLYALNNVQLSGVLQRDIRDNSLNLWWLLIVIPMIALIVFVIIYRRRILRMIKVVIRRIRRKLRRTRKRRSR